MHMDHANESWIKYVITHMSHASCTLIMRISHAFCDLASHLLHHLVERQTNRGYLCAVTINAVYV